MAKLSFICPICQRYIKTKNPDPTCTEGHVPIEMTNVEDEDAMNLAMSVGCGCG